MNYFIQANLFNRSNWCFIWKLLTHAYILPPPLISAVLSCDVKGHLYMHLVWRCISMSWHQLSLWQWSLELNLGIKSQCTEEQKSELQHKSSCCSAQRLRISTNKAIYVISCWLLSCHSGMCWQNVFHLANNSDESNYERFPGRKKYITVPQTLVGLPHWSS